jgi:hypothetical protein
VRRAQDAVCPAGTEAMMQPTPLTTEQRRDVFAAMVRALRASSSALFAEVEVNQPGGPAEIETHVNALVDIVRRSTATSIEPYLAQIFDDICKKCAHQFASTYCPLRSMGGCVLCSHTATIVAAIAGALREIGDANYAGRHSLGNDGALTRP